MQHYDSHLICQEIGKCGFKINVTPKAIEKYMKQTKNKVIKSGFPEVFIDRVYFLKNPVDNLVIKLGKMSVTFQTKNLLLMY